MRIKKYTASSMKEALLKIKEELGEDAMILKTSKLPKKMFSFGEQPGIEVTAALDETAQKKPSRFPPIQVTDPGVYSYPGKPQKAPVVKPESVLPPPRITKREDVNLPKKDDLRIAPLPPEPSAPSKSSGPMTDRFHFPELHEDLMEMKKLLASILATGESTAAGGFAGPWAILYKRLIDSEIKQNLALDLIQKLKNTTDDPEESINKKFIAVLKESFPVSGPLVLKKDGPLVVAMVGPTGAGKTTTIAKLAAYCSIYKENTVSIITADTYRIAAIEQIRTFAEIVDIGLQVIFSPEEAHDVLGGCENDDVVFIDTAGRSQRNNEHMRELEKYLEVMKPDEIHLVLSATTKDSDLQDVIKRYRDLNTNRLLFTKLDETAKLGNVFNTVCTGGIPVSYLASGQSVPEDIELAQPGRFVRRLLEGSSL